MTKQKAKKPLSGELQEAILTNHEKRIKMLEGEIANLKAFMILKGMNTIED